MQRWSAGMRFPGAGSPPGAQSFLTWCRSGLAEPWHRDRSFMGGHMGVATAPLVLQHRGPLPYLRLRLRGLHVRRGRHQVGQPRGAMRADHRPKSPTDAGQSLRPRGLLGFTRAGRKAGRGRAGDGQQRHGQVLAGGAGLASPHRLSINGRSVTRDNPGRSNTQSLAFRTPTGPTDTLAMQDQLSGESVIIEIPLLRIRSAVSLVPRQVAWTEPHLARYRNDLALYAAGTYTGADIRAASRAALCGLIVVRNPPQTRDRACSRAVPETCRRLGERSGWGDNGRPDRGCCCIRGSSLAAPNWQARHRRCSWAVGRMRRWDPQVLQHPRQRTPNEADL